MQLSVNTLNLRIIFVNTTLKNLLVNFSTQTRSYKSL